MTSKPIINTAVGALSGLVQNITGSAQSIVFPVSEEDGAVLLQMTGNAVGHNSTFEGTTDGTNWITLVAVRTDTVQISTSTSTVAGNLAYGFWIFPAGLAAFRIRSTAHSSGTATWTAAYLAEGVMPPLLAVNASLAGSTSLTNALLASRITAALTGAVIKNSPGRFHGGVLTNHAAAIRYVHIYNKASAATLGTDTPVLTFGLAPGQSIAIPTDVGVGFAVGMAWAATTDNAASPATVATAGDVSGSFFYI